MKLNKLIKPLVVSCLTPLALMANAADDHMNFVTLRAGMDQPTISNNHAYANSAATTFAGGLEVGRKLNQMFALGLEYSYRSKSSFDMAEQYTPTAQDGYQKSNSTWAVSSDVFMLNLTTNLVQDAKMTPYIKVGAGVARNKSHDYVQTDETTQPTIFPGTTKNNFAWQLGAGLNVAMNDRFDVDFAYSYLNRGKVTTKAYQLNNLTITSDTAKYVKLADHSFTIGIKFKF